MSLAGCGELSLGCHGATKPLCDSWWLTGSLLRTSLISHLAFARMARKPLELQMCLEQGPWLGCLLAPCPVCKLTAKCTVFLIMCEKMLTLETEILKGPCSVSKTCFSISEYFGPWEHPASCAVLLLLPGRVGWGITLHVPSAARPCKPSSFDICISCSVPCPGCDL